MWDPYTLYSHCASHFAALHANQSESRQGQLSLAQVCSVRCHVGRCSTALCTHDLSLSPCCCHLASAMFERHRSCCLSRPGLVTTFLYYCRDTISLPDVPLNQLSAIGKRLGLPLVCAAGLACLLCGTHLAYGFHAQGVCKSLAGLCSRWADTSQFSVPKVSRDTPACAREPPSAHCMHQCLSAAYCSLPARVTVLACCHGSIIGYLGGNAKPTLSWMCSGVLSPACLLQHAIAGDAWAAVC